MAFDFTKPITVTTVDSNDYPRPQLNADGQWVVSASAVNQEKNKMVLYDPLTLRITPITPYTASLDLYNKAQSYENILAKMQLEQDVQRKGMSISSDNNQVNSLADVITAGNEDFGPIDTVGNFITDVIPKVVTGKFKEAGTSWWEHSEWNWMLDKAHAALDFVNNTIIDPFVPEKDYADQIDALKRTDPDYKIEQQHSLPVKLLNNAIVNLSESMDFITGANIVKGFVQGIPQGLDQAVDNVVHAQGNVYSTKGRAQYDWDLHPTGTALDTGVNIFLEVVTDPSTWVSFGTSVLLKRAAQSMMPNVLVTSAKKYGAEMSQDAAENFTKNIMQAIIYKDKKLMNTISGLHVDGLDASLKPAFLQTVAEGLRTAKEYRLMRALTTVRGGTDMLEKAVWKATFNTSAIGLGLGAFKWAYKATNLGLDALAYLLSKTNNAVKNSGVTSLSLQTLNTMATTMTDSLSTVTSFLDIADTSPHTLVRRMTQQYQEDVYMRLQLIANKDSTFQDKLSALNRFAQENGAPDINTLMRRLVDNQDVVPEVTKRIAQDVQNAVIQITKEAQIEFIKAVQTELSPQKFYRSGDIALKDMSKALQLFPHIPHVRAQIPDALLYRAQDLILKARAARRALRANAIYAQLKDTGFLDYGESLVELGKDFSYKFSFDVEEALSVKRHITPDEREEMLNALSILDKHFSKIINPEWTQTIRSLLTSWKGTQYLFTADVRNVNIMYTNIVEAIKAYIQGIEKYVPNFNNANDAWKEVVKQQQVLYSVNKLLNYSIKSINSSHQIAPTPGIALLSSGMVGTVNGEVYDMIADTLKNSHFGTNKSPKDVLVRQFGMQLGDGVHNKETTRLFVNTYNLTQMLLDIPELEYILARAHVDDGILVQWRTAGFSIDIGHELLGVLGDLIERLTYTSRDHLGEKYSRSKIRENEASITMPKLHNVNRAIHSVDELEVVEDYDGQLRVGLKEIGREDVLVIADTTLPKTQKIVLDVNDDTFDGQLSMQFTTDVEAGKTQRNIREDVDDITALPNASAVNQFVGYKEYTAKKSYTVEPSNAKDLLETIEDIYNETQDIINVMYAGVEDHVKVTPEIFASNLYALKESQFSSLMRLLSVPELDMALEQIRRGTGLGMFLDALHAGDADNYVAEAAANLKGLANSVYVFRKVLSRIQRTSLFSKEILTGIYDTFGGMSRQDVSNIVNPKTLAHQILHSAKRYVDRSHNAESFRLLDLSYTKNPLQEVEELTRYLQKEVPSDVHDIWVKNYNDYFKPIREALARDENLSYDTVYSASQTYKEQGQIYQIAFKEADSTPVLFVNHPRREAFKANLTEQVSRDLFGKNLAQAKTDLLSQDEYFTQHGDVVQYFDNDEDFAAAVHAQLEHIKDAADELGLPPRLLGYNTSVDALGTTKVLADFTYKNYLNTFIDTDNAQYKSILSIEALDIAEYLEAASGAVGVTDAEYTEMTDILTDAKEYLDYQNLEQEHAKTCLVPNFTRRVTSSLREILAALDEMLKIQGHSSDILKAEQDTDEVLVQTAKGSNVNIADNLVNLTRAQYELINVALDPNSISDLNTRVSVLLQHLGDEMTAVSEMNSKYAQDLIIQNNLTKLVGTPNLMRIVTEHFVSPNGVSPLSLKKYFIPEVYSRWFSDTPKDLSVLLRLYKFADHMEKMLPSIKHINLLMATSPTELREVIRVLHSMFLQSPNRKWSLWYDAMMAVRRDMPQPQLYLLAVDYWRAICSMNKKDELIQDLLETLTVRFKGSPIIWYVTAPYDSILYNKPLYTPTVPVQHSKLIADDNKFIIKHKELEAVDKALMTLKTVEDSLEFSRSLADLDLAMPSVKVKEPLVRRYGDFVRTVRSISANAEAMFKIAADNDDPHMRYIARKDYDAAIDSLMEALRQLKQDTNLRRVMCVLNLDAESYVKYLYKYSQGIQIMFTNATVFKEADANMQKLLHKFTTMLRDAHVYGLEYVEVPETGELIIYLNKEHINIDDLEKLTEDFTIHAPKLKVPEATVYSLPIIRDVYDKFVDEMDSVTGGAYNWSNLRTMHGSNYDELLEYLPDGVTSKLITKETLYDLGYLDNVFAHNMLGDYGSGTGTIFKYYSNNIITNVAAGFNAAFHNIHGKELYINLIMAPENKLQAKVLKMSRFGEISMHSIYNALKDSSLVIVRYDEQSGLKDIPLKSVEHLTELANDTDVAILDYLSYSRASEILKHKHGEPKDKGLLYHLQHISKDYLSLLKISQLSSLGWYLRNIPDSTLKGWVQAGLDPQYMMSLFNKTERVLGQYDHTYLILQRLTDGRLYDELVDNFFELVEHTPQKLIAGVIPIGGHFTTVDEWLEKTGKSDLGNRRVYRVKEAELKDILDRNTYKKLSIYYSTTSSVATPAQLNLFNDIAGKLYNQIKGNMAIKLSDVEVAVKVFVEIRDGALAKQKLIELGYTDDTLADLLRIRRYVPKKAIEASLTQRIVESVYPLRGLMRMSTSFEAKIRAHTFLYHSVYTGGTVEDAVKMVDESQFNTTRSSDGQKIIEDLFPFSTFQYHNVLFWEDAMKHGHHVAALIEDVINGWYNTEEIDPEELMRNASLQYLFLSGNLILDDSTGAYLKLNPSLYSVFSLGADPLGTMSGMFNVPIKALEKLISGIFSDPDKYEKDPYNNSPHISQFSERDIMPFVQLIPLFGVMAQRMRTAYKQSVAADVILPFMFPSVFGVVKLDSAGTTYESRPVGTNWYDRDEEYKKTHRYVFGVSYVPAWMHKDPLTYADTYGRLVKMGYTEEMAAHMMQSGWYMKAPDYTLKHYTPSGQGRYIKKHYARRYYAKRPRISRAYPKYSTLPKKQKKFNMKSSRYQRFNTDRSKVVRGYRARRIYRMQLYSNRYTRTGVSREAMINWRGPNRSSRQLLRDRSRSSRMRQRNIIRQIKPS